jgi:hypothetical protein
MYMNIMELDYNVQGEERRKLVQLVSEITDIATVYKKVPTCAYDIGTFTVSKDGVLSWTEDTDVDAVNTVIAGLKMMGFTAKEEKKVTKKVVEVKTTTQPDVPKQLQEQADDETDKLIVETPRRLMDDKALANLDRIIEGKGSLTRKAIGADRIEYEITKDRIRFPWFALTEDAEEAKAYTTFISELAEQPRTAKRVPLKDKPVDNEKYAFRCFLLWLGFIGEEYKTARKILLRNLTGNTAFRNGRPAKEEQPCE